MIKYLYVNKEHISDALSKADIESFFNIICSKLDLRISYEIIIIKDLGRDLDGYCDEHTMGRTIFENNYSDFKHIELYIQTIAEKINNQFGKLKFDNRIRESIIRCYLEFAIAHELYHIYQMQKESLRELIETEAKKQHNDRCYEIEANKYAFHEVGSEQSTEFEREVLKYIESGSRLDNERATCLERMIEIS